MDRLGTEGDRLGLFLMGLAIEIRMRDAMLKTRLDRDVQSVIPCLGGGVVKAVKNQKAGRGKPRGRKSNHLKPIFIQVFMYMDLCMC